jgi:hypothetical protein
VNDFKFFLTDKAKRDCKKAKHAIEQEIAETVRKILVLNPEYGEAIATFGILRKMRVAIPKEGFGKRGGYCLIYTTQVIDETRYFIFLRIYFKADTEDLTRSEYQDLVTLSKNILENWLDYTWEDFDLSTLLEN